MISTAARVARIVDPASERVAFDHEHGRLYEALERTAQLAELAGDDSIARDLRTMRRTVAKHIEQRWCGGG